MNKFPKQQRKQHKGSGGGAAYIAPAPRPPLHSTLLVSSKNNDAKDRKRK